MDKIQTTRNFLQKKIFPLIGQGNYWLAGGSIQSLLTDSKINDYDIFSNGLSKELKHNLLCNKYIPFFENDRVAKFRIQNQVLDIVKIPFESPETTIQSFDFTVSGAAIDSQGKFYCLDRFWQDLATRKLVINRIDHPLSTLRRMQKYIKKGFTICNGGMIQIAEALRKPDIDLTTQHLYMD